MKLSDIKIGQTVRVIKLETEKRTTERLNNMGLINGVRITLKRKAPLGDPLQIKLRDFYLAIRVVDANKITVEECE